VGPGGPVPVRSLAREAVDMGLLGQRSDDDEERGDISIAGMEHLGSADEETVYELDD
jgi:hypothetical protein